MKLIFNRAKAILFILAIFLFELVLSSLKVLWWIYTRPRRLQSEIYELDLKVEQDWQRILLAHFITLTPGTLTIDILDTNTLLIHCLDKSSWEGTKELVQEKLEPLLLDWNKR